MLEKGNKEEKKSTSQ